MYWNKKKSCTSWFERNKNDHYLNTLPIFIHFHIDAYIFILRCVSTDGVWGRSPQHKEAERSGADVEHEIQNVREGIWRSQTAVRVYESCGRAQLTYLKTLPTQYLHSCGAQAWSGIVLPRPGVGPVFVYICFVYTANKDKISAWYKRRSPVR